MAVAHCSLQLSEEEAGALIELLTWANWNEGEGHLLEGIYDALQEAGFDSIDYSSELQRDEDEDDDSEILIEAR